METASVWFLCSISLPNCTELKEFLLRPDLPEKCLSPEKNMQFAVCPSLCSEPATVACHCHRMAARVIILADDKTFWIATPSSRKISYLHKGLLILSYFQTLSKPSEMFLPGLWRHHYHACITLPVCLQWGRIMLPSWRGTAFQSHMQTRTGP